VDKALRGVSRIIQAQQRGRLRKVTFAGAVGALHGAHDSEHAAGFVGKRTVGIVRFNL